MSIQSVKNQLQETIAKYNAKKNEIAKMYATDNRHSKEWIDIQLRVLRTDLKKEYLSVIDKIKADLRTAENGSQKEIAKVMYPYSISDNDSKKLAGELQQNNANLFLMSNPKTEQVLSAIRTAIATDRTDYAFMLIETVKNRVQGDYTEENKKIMKELEEIVSGFDTSGKIKEYEKDLSGLSVVKDTVSSFERFVSNEYFTEAFIPKETILSMSQEEVNQNISSINASLAA